MTDNPIVIWFNTYGLIPTIIAFIIMISFYLNLRNNFNNLKTDLGHFKEEYNSHPIIFQFNQWVKTQGLFYFYNDILKNSNTEKKKND
jgi:hypothetical protein